MDKLFNVILFVGGVGLGYMVGSIASNVSNMFSFKSIDRDKNTATIELVSPKDTARKAPIVLPLDKDYLIEYKEYTLRSTCLRPGVLSVVLQKNGLGLANMTIDATEGVKIS